MASIMGQLLTSIYKLEMMFAALQRTTTILLTKTSLRTFLTRMISLLNTSMLVSIRLFKLVRQ